MSHYKTTGGLQPKEGDTPVDKRKREKKRQPNIRMASFVLALAFVPLPASPAAHRVHRVVGHILFGLSHYFKT